MIRHLSVCMSFTKLDLDRNGIKRVYNMSHKSYQILILNKNYLTYLPCDLLPSTLKYLSLDQNDLSHLELDIPFPHLQTLSAEKNKICYIDLQTILPSLDILNVKQNYISNLQFLECLPTLKQLNLSSNDVRTLQHLPSSLETLNADFCKISMIQSRLPQGLQELSLYGNSLRMGSLPLHWGSQLRILNLGDNELTLFPKRLPDSLEELALQDNKLTEIPSSLPPNLRILSLNRNRIRSLPKRINVRLDVLLVSHNRLIQDFEKDPILYAAHFFESDNWNQEFHHKSQILLRKCWKRYILKKRLRHFYRSCSIRAELLMIALHPDRILQTDTFSSQWVN